MRVRSSDPAVAQSHSRTRRTHSRSGARDAAARRTWGIFVGDAGRWTCIGRYLVAVCLASLAWEALQMPLYTLWKSGTSSALAADVFRCSLVDVVIAFGSLGTVLVLFGMQRWPRGDGRRVALLTCAFAVVYTAFSEWLNVDVLRTWAYSDLMPTVPSLGVGLSPLLQWIVIPVAALWWARRSIEARPE